MPPTVVKASAQGNGASGSTATGAFAGGNTSGNCLVVHCQADNASVTGAQMDAAFSDTAGNSYLRVAGAGESTFHSSTFVYVCKSCKAGANSLLLPPPGAATGYHILGIEVTGADPVNPVDSAATQQLVQLNTGALTVTLPLSKANELIVWCYEQGTGGQTTTSITPGYTELPAPSSHCFITHSSGLTLAAGSNTVNVAKGNGWWSSCAIALFEGGGAKRTLVGVGR